MSKLMQLHQVILSAFATKGYSLQTPISRKQLMKVITILVKQKNNHQSQQPIDQAILNQIWKQTTQRIQNDQTLQPRTQQSIILEDVIQSFIDAIEILSNRINQCSSSIEQMIIKRKQLQNQKDYTRAEMLHHKMVTLSSDLKQFQKDLVSLTYPFNQNISELAKKLSIRKNSGQKSPPVSKKSLQIDIPLLQNKSSTSNQHITNNNNNNNNNNKQLQQYMKENNNKYLQPQTVDDAKNVTLWILGLLLCLQCTVIIVKYSFVNLMMILLGFFVLLQSQFKPGMIKIAIYSCSYSILMDGSWLGYNSMNYINPTINTGLTLLNKKYQLYVLFLTIVQMFVKFIYLWLLKRYQNLEIVYLQQIQKEQSIQQQQQSFQSKNRQIVDNYIPNMKEFLKIQNPPPSKA